jgi:hypothetical protein
MFKDPSNVPAIVVSPSADTCSAVATSVPVEPRLNAYCDRAEEAARGVTASEEGEYAEAPAALMARTENMYEVAGVNPVNTRDGAEEDLVVAPVTPVAGLPLASVTLNS